MQGSTKQRKRCWRGTGQRREECELSEGERSGEAFEDDSGPRKLTPASQMCAETKTGSSGSWEAELQHLDKIRASVRLQKEERRVFRARRRTYTSLWPKSGSGTPSSPWGGGDVLVSMLFPISQNTCIVFHGKSSWIK